MSTVYVPDTHALLWFLANSSRLSNDARSAFHDELAGQATIYVPAIVIAELIWVVRAGRIKVDLPVLLSTIRNNYTVTSLTVDDVMQLSELPENLTIHDAMIVWETKKRDATLITRDETIVTAGIVPTLW